MAQYGGGSSEPSEPKTPTPPAQKTESGEKEQGKKLLQGCGCLLFLLIAFVGCVGVFTPQKLTEKCERDLQSRYGLKGYSRKYSTGFVTSSQGERSETISWQFFYDGPKGNSIAAQEQRAPVYKGQAWCRINKDTKEVKSRFDRVLFHAGE